MKHSLILLVGTTAASLHAPALSQSNDGDFTLEVESFGGVDVVPPDIIESDVDQDRLEGVIGGAAVAQYRLNDTRISAQLGAEVFPSESLFNRYTAGGGVAQDIPIANNGRIRARIGATYEHVFGEEGRVFDRARGDAQLIVRHGQGHTTVSRLRYGYRDQSEERFVGFDQDELLGELRHTWRKPGTNTLVSAAVFALDVDAEDDRFSFRGLGGRVIARTDIGDDFVAFGRISYVRRDYEAPFSTQFPVRREDDAFRISAGLERQFGDQVTGFAELGYIDHASNVPTRDFQGTIGQAGIRIRM